MHLQRDPHITVLRYVYIRYIRFREPRALEAWECRQARKSGKIVINGRTFESKIGATASHSMFLGGRLDDESKCEVGIVTLPS
jgi:hypothetical protein